MMQKLVDVGRNAPCPCGSGHKFKKCCLERQRNAILGDWGELDVVALVDKAIRNDDWVVLDYYMDQSMNMFVRGAPLEHIRFRDDSLLLLHEPDLAVTAKLFTGGWLQRCERELARVLALHALAPSERDSLRVAAHLLRRFGARSPLVEKLAHLQFNEQADRLRRVTAALSTSKIESANVTEGYPDLAEWLDRARPPVLSFADWFTLRLSSEKLLAEAWASSIAIRVCEVCLDRLAGPVDDRRSWALLAATTALDRVPAVGEVLAMVTPLRDPSRDEQAVYDLIQKRREELEIRDMGEIIYATETRGDYAGAALLRETVRMLQYVLRMAEPRLTTRTDRH
jgi:hypothetical protein